MEHKNFGVRNPILVGFFEIYEVFNFIQENPGAGVKMFRDKYPVFTDSLRYRTFKNNLTCVNCGLVGTYFGLEKGNERDSTFHFNLYAVNNNGLEVLMTKDHILPRSKGGKDGIYNMQTMCTICNGEKGNKITN